MEPYQELELKWAAFNDLDPKGMVACSSGTSALHLSLEALQLPPDSEAIVPDFTMVACARAVILAGLTPVFVDCDGRLLIDVRLLEKVLGEEEGSCLIKAIMIVHIYGRKVDMDLVHSFARKRGLFVIEDLAEAHGVNPHPETHAVCHSFYCNKIVAGQEGGAVWFRNPDRAALARRLRSLGFTSVHDFMHVPRGCNYRLSNANADMVLDSLAMVETNLAMRREIESWYDAACPDEWLMPPRDVPWVYDLRIKGMTSEQQDRLVTKLNLVHIVARHGFKPMSEQEEFRGCRVVGNGNAARLAREVIYLPIVPGKTSRQDAALSFNIIKRTA
jgi:perosamine synthetase